MSKKDTVLMLPLLTIMVLISVYILAGKVLLPSIFESKAKITAYNQDIERSRSKIESISNASGKITELSSLVNDLLLAVPDSNDSPNLITEIESIASANNIILVNLVPPSTLVEGQSGVSGVATNVTISGTFQDTLNFINSLENIIRFSKIDSLSISDTEGSVLTTTINYKVFVRPAVKQLASGGVAE